MTDLVDDDQRWFSNPNKPERERAVCRAFLRALGIKFQDQELIAPGPEPADVIFRDARFQVREILRDRRPGDERRNRREQLRSAKSLTDLLEKYCPPSPDLLESLVPEIAEALSEKATRYGQVGCSQLDALVYCNFIDRRLDAESPMPETIALKVQGWRSVSLLYPPFGITLIADDLKLSFLQSARHQPHSQWKDVYTLFDP